MVGLVATFMNRGEPRGGTAPGWLKRAKSAIVHGKAPERPFQAARAPLSGPESRDQLPGWVGYYRLPLARVDFYRAAARRQVRARRSAPARTPARTRRSSRGG